MCRSGFSCVTYNEDKLTFNLGWVDAISWGKYKENLKSFESVIMEKPLLWLNVISFPQLSLKANRKIPYPERECPYDFGYIETTEYVLLQCLYYRDNYGSCMQFYYCTKTQSAQDNSTPPCCLQILTLLQHIILPSSAQQCLKSVRRWPVP